MRNIGRTRLNFQCSVQTINGLLRGIAFFRRSVPSALAQGVGTDQREENASKKKREVGTGGNRQPCKNPNKSRHEAGSPQNRGDAKISTSRRPDHPSGSSPEPFPDPR